MRYIGAVSMRTALFSRREFLAGALAVPGALRAASAPSMPVAIAKCPSYNEDLAGKLRTLFDQIGGVGSLVRGKTVTVKLNLTGNPNGRFQGLVPGKTHWSNETLTGALCRVLGEQGAKRIRFVESGSVPADTLDEYLMGGGWDVKALKRAAPLVELVRTNNLNGAKKYVRLKVPSGGYMFPAFDVHPAYEETDVYVTLAKLKNHRTCGVTLSLKNNFGVAPNAIYGEDAGIDEPNERARRARNAVFHEGKRGPSKSAPQELKPGSSTEAGYRVPRIVTDLASARPIDLVVIDGVETITGGEGPWYKAKVVAPGVLLAGRNPVCTDAVAAAVMGYDPSGDRGAAPFQSCDSHIKLAEAIGMGTADLSRIEVAGAAIKDVRFDFDAAHNS